MSFNKRASLEISIQAIVIVVLAMTILGLGLGFVRGLFKNITSTTEDVTEQVRQKILDDKYDYFLSLEQDVIPPKNIIERLLQHKKRVVTGIYFNYINVKKSVELAPVVWSKVNMEKEERYFLKPSELNKGLIKIAMSGLGCILIHRSILEKIKFRYEKKYPAFDDIFFGLDCKKNKINIYADTNLACKHLIKNRPWSWKNLK